MTGGSRPDEDRLVELMQAYQAGRFEAFETLYATLAPELSRYFSALLRDASRVPDLVQESFLRIHRSRHTYDPTRPLRPWVFAIARHVYLMDRRARLRRATREVGLESPADARPDPSSSAAAEGRGLAEALAYVPAERRTPLVLHHFWGMSFREIARALGIREGAARVRASRALADLRRRFGVRRDS